MPRVALAALQSPHFRRGGGGGGWGCGGGGGGEVKVY